MLISAHAAGTLILSSAETIKSGGKGSGGAKNSSSLSDSSATWVSLLPEAQAALVAVMVHQHGQGIAQAGQLLLQAASQVRQQQLGVSVQQPSQQKPKDRKQKYTPSDSSNANISRLLTLSGLTGYLAATVDYIQQSRVVGDVSAAATAADIAVKLLVQVLGVPPPSASAASSISALPALLTADVIAYSLVVQLLGVGGRYDWVAHLTSLAIRHRLPLTAAATGSETGLDGGSTTCTWSASDLQCMIAAVADVWLNAGRSGLALAMLDGLTAAGVFEVDCAELAAVVMNLVDADGQVRAVYHELDPNVRTNWRQFVINTSM